MNNDMCFICYDEGYLVKIPCNNCNLFIHPLCLEKLIDNFGFVCKVCKSNYNLSLEQIIIDPINNNNEIYQINELHINRRIIIKRLQICIIIFFIIFILFLIAYYYIRIFN
jgi:hypothetical protein